MVESVRDYIYTVELENRHHIKTTHGESCVVITGYTAVPHYDENGSLIAYDGLVRDVTESKRTQDMLIQSAKLVSVGELAANIAHEINNPMTSVLGYTSIILEDMEEGAPYYEDLKIIEEESLRIRDIIRSLLDFAR